MRLPPMLVDEMLRFMRTLLRPYVGDFYVEDVRVIQHAVLVNQLELESAIRGCIDGGERRLMGEPRSAFMSTTVDIYGEDMEIDGVPMSHQATISRGIKRTCHIKVAAGDDMTKRLAECFSAICNRLYEDVQKALPGE